MSNFPKCGWNGCGEEADQHIHARRDDVEFHGPLCGVHADEIVKAIGPVMLQRACLRPISAEALIASLSEQE